MLGSFLLQRKIEPFRTAPPRFFLFKQSCLNYKYRLVLCSSKRVKVGNQVYSLDTTIDGGHGKWSTVGFSKFVWNFWVGSEYIPGGGVPPRCCSCLACGAHVNEVNLRERFRLVGFAAD